MATKKYTDWKGWLEGFYDSWIDSLCSTALAFGGSNAIGQVPGLHSLGLNLEQAGGIFISVTFWSIIRYLQAHKRPEVITETVEQIFESKTGSGQTISQAIKTTTTTPVDPAPPVEKP